MILETQYITQCISNAANNLRLSSEKIEVVTLLREHIENCDNIETEIIRLKKITEFSKIAIKLWELYTFISSNNIDFSKISDVFRNQSYSLVTDLSNLLDVLTPHTFNKIIFKDLNDSIDVDFSEKSISNSDDELAENEVENVAVEKDEDNEEKKINEDDNKLNLSDYISNVLSPINDLDDFLSSLISGKNEIAEYDHWIRIIKSNYEQSLFVDEQVVASMLYTVCEGLNLIKTNKLEKTKDNIASLRACLIVVVALVRKKDVDISNYIKRAENMATLIENKLKD